MPEPSKWHQRSDPAKIDSMAAVAAGAWLELHCCMYRGL